jgi:hypothetical protein
VGEVRIRWDDWRDFFEVVVCGAEALGAGGWVGGVSSGCYGSSVGCNEGVWDFAEVHFWNFPKYLTGRPIEIV